MATQDIAYINHRRSQEVKKLEKLQSELHFLGSTPRNNHTIFVDNAVELKTFDPLTYFNTVPELLNRTYNRIRTETLASTSLQAPKAKVTNHLAKLRDQSYAELGQRVQRLDKLTEASHKMQTMKNLMGKGARRKISKPGELPVYKWKKERKK